jgi:uroporphyrinogen decarboxylase
MTPKERFLSALALDMPDRIPTMHIQLGGGNRLQDITGLTIKEAYSDPEKFAQMCLATREFGFDNVMVGWGDLLNEAQAFGVKLSFPNERDYPRGVPILPEDIDKLDYVDPMKDRVWSASLEAAKIVNGKVGKEMAVIGQVSDPFTLAASVRGFDGLLMDEIMEPDRLHHLLKVLTDSLTEYGRLLKDHSGVEIIFIEDGSADSEQNEFQLAKTFDIDYAQTMADRFHQNGQMTILSNCAKGAYLEAQFDAVKPSAIHTSYDWDGYANALKMLKGKGCLAAGILPHFIARSNPEEIRQKVSELIGSSGDGSGLIVTSAGEIPFDAPPENLKVLGNSTNTSSIA